MRKKGVDVSKGAGIAGVVGAVVFSPILWIAGPVQSAQLRQAHERVTRGRASLDPISGSTGGLQMKLSF